MKLSAMFKGIRVPRPPSPAVPVSVEPPQRCLVPLRQHRGAVCAPKVQAGDLVAKGQVIGDSEEFETACVHAPVSGKVESIIQLPDPNGENLPTVVIVSDGKDQWEGEAATVAASLEDVAEARPSHLLKALREAGLVRASVHGLPLHMDLSPPMAPRSYLYMTGIPVVRPIDTLIIRAVDQDPPVAPNAACLGAPAQTLAIGIAALAKISGAKRVIIAAPSGAKLGELAEIAGQRGWEIAYSSPTHYPYAHRNLMVQAMTGREVPTPYGEPRDVGVAMEPLITAYEAGLALAEGRPPLERILAVTGAVKQPGIYKARLGTPVSEVLAAAGGVVGKTGKILAGGPMMGLALYNQDTPVTKETTGFHVQSAGEEHIFGNHPCIHCGRCVAACPVNLVPAEISKLCEFGRFADAADLADLFHCIECGVCAYVCPAKRPMVHFFRHGKSEVLAERSEA